jgi:hypothetical protein
MKSFTIVLEESDIERTRELALEQDLPPHVFARAVFLRGLRSENESWESAKQSKKSKGV